MFKSLSPDDSFHKDVKLHMETATNTTASTPKGKHCNVLSPRDVSPQAKVLASGQQGKLDFRFPKAKRDLATEYARNLSSNVPRTRTKLILNTKRDQKKKTAEAEKAATAKAMQKGTPDAIKVKPPGENTQKQH